MKLALLLSLFFIILSESSWGQACQDINYLKEEPLKSKHSVYQREANWCAGFALSDALSMHVGKPVSGVDLIISKKKKQTVDSTDSLLVEYNSIEDMLSGVNDFGLCLEEKYKIPFFGTYIPSILYLERVYKNDSRFCEHEKIVSVVEQSFYSNISDIINVINEAKLEKSFSDFLFRLSQENCKNNRITSFNFLSNHSEVPFLRKISLSNSTKHLNVVRKSLINNQVPLIGVDPTIFSRTKEHGLMSFRTSNLKNKFNGTHIVSVVGMENINGQCYYRVRDSNMECHNTSEEILDCDPKTASMLVPENVLADSAKHIYTISKTEK